MADDRTTPHAKDVDIDTYLQNSLDRIEGTKERFEMAAEGPPQPGQERDRPDHSLVAIEHKLPDPIPLPKESPTLRSKTFLAKGLSKYDEQATLAKFASDHTEYEDTSKGLRYEICESTILPYAPEFVWDVLLQTEHLGRWLGTGMGLEPDSKAY